MVTKQQNKKLGETDTLDVVGAAFHTFEKDEKGMTRVKHQGLVLSSPMTGWYFVQLFEWLVGQPTIRKLVNIEEMADWHFYGSLEEMKDEYHSKWGK